MPSPPFRYLFGPVPSRRFGRSLGVDLTPMKTCSLDCIFCQLGHTPEKTITRREYVPTEEVIKELQRWQRDGGQTDFITLSGSGEPTLHSQFGEVLRYIRHDLPFPSVLLSNGTFFSRPEVREAAQAADIVKLSLSAWDPKSFQQVNHPHEGIDLEQMIEGMRTFRKAYTGKIWLEVFLIPGLNTSSRAIEQLVQKARGIIPDAIHLNTAVRPPAETSVEPMTREAMEALAPRFQPPATIIAGFPKHSGIQIEANEDRILDMLRRRPCTARQIAEAFGMHINEVSKYTGALLRSRQIDSEVRNQEIYFKAAPSSET
jgi:wyosine [tRNA(Phe)-imidazoG37] synthetase (radical SAM superfamily)